MKYFILPLIGVFFYVNLLRSQNAINNTFTIVSYNVENLFDTINDPNKSDEQFLPNGTNNWTYERYQTKLNNLAKVLSSINTNNLPQIISLIEIENHKVLEDLINTKPLSDNEYKIVHNESPDKRGIDVALLYDPHAFTYINHKIISINFPFAPNTKTRDILYVTGKTNLSDTLHIFVNHWPSRRGGKEKSEPKRKFVAQKLKFEIDSLFKINPNQKIIIVGDFNDNPTNKSLYDILEARNFKNTEDTPYLYNLLFDTFNDNNFGSYFYRNKYSMLDNIIISNYLINCESGYSCDFDKGKIFAPKWLKDPNPKYAKSPFRTYVGSKYLGGYSDHFPVYFILYTKE